MTGAPSDPGGRHVVCLLTAPRERSREIAAALVENRLAACVNIVPLVESVYRWQGKVEHDEESLLVIKATRAAVEPMIEAIRTVHPYENFELIALEVVAGSPPYLQWIAESVNLGPASP